MHFGFFFKFGTKRFVTEKKKKTNWEEEDDKVGAMRSWSSKLATQHRSPVTAFIFVFCSYFFFFLPFLLLLFLLSVSTAVVSEFLTFSLFVLVLNSFLCFQSPFMWLALGKKKTFDFWIKDGKMFQPLDLGARDMALATSLYFFQEWYNEQREHAVLFCFCFFDAASLVHCGHYCIVHNCHN